MVYMYMNACMYTHKICTYMYNDHKSGLHEIQSYLIKTTDVQL